MRIIETIRPRGATRSVAVWSALVALLLCPTPGARGGDDEAPQARPVVLVPPFENLSKERKTISYEVGTGGDRKSKRRYTIDRFTEVPRTLLEDMLGNIEGVTVVERQRIDTLLLESEFGRLSGLVDPDKAVKLGKMLGANLIVMGTIVDIRDEAVVFSGYGVNTQTVKVECKVRIRLLDAATGDSRFTKVVTGTKSYSVSDAGGTGSSDRAVVALEEALKKLDSDAQFREALLGRKRDAGAKRADDMVEVEFTPKPDNCDIEIDGKHVGGSPLKRRLRAGKDVKVRIAKAGYLSWETVITPEPNLRITRELEKK